MSVKKIIFLVFSFLLSQLGLSQEPVSWQTSFEKLDANEYLLSFKASIDKNWHLYGIDMPENGPLPTIFNYDLEKNQILTIDKIIESESKTEYDKFFEMDLDFFENNASFKQRIFLKDTLINALRGDIQYQVCDDKTCVFRTKSFVFNLNGLNETNNKINIKSSASGELIFYDPTLGYCDLSSCYISTLPKLNYNLGYYLGFRGPNFAQDGSLLSGQQGVTQENWENNSLIITWGSGKNEIAVGDATTGFAQVNINTSITAILNVDDFNSSTFSENVQLVNPPNNRISLPNYYNKSIPCDVSGSIPDTKKTTVFTQNPRKYTYAQLYTIQQILSQHPNL